MATTIENLTAASRPFAAELRYADGTVERVAQPRRAQAERIVARYAPLIGEELQLRNADLTTRRSVLVTAEVVSA